MRAGSSTPPLGKPTFTEVQEKTYSKIKTAAVHQPLDFCNSK